MINELYNLTKALDAAEIQTEKWHTKYNEISKNNTCIRISILNSSVTEVSVVKPDLKGEIRRFGTKHGSYPAMNLASLYRVTSEDIKKAINELERMPEQFDEDKIREIQSWCQEDNWESKKFQNKYRISMEDTVEELLKLIPTYAPIQILAEESNGFRDQRCLHQELEKVAFKMLQDRKEVSLALQILFYMGKQDALAEDDFGTLSVALDTPRLIKIGIPAVSRRFVTELNNALLATESAENDIPKGQERDAFDMPYSPVGEPMPNVKLPAGFEVILRTMSSNDLCQNRYNRNEDAGYPISREMRARLRASLGWLGKEERKNITWINIDKNEVMFVYPESFPKTNVAFTRMFRPPKENKKSFEAESKQFISELRLGRDEDTDSHGKHIQIFILRKLDKARTKVVYTRQTDPMELEKRSEEWTAGRKNLPSFSFGSIFTPFPLGAADILNRFWKQDGTLATDKFKPIPKYHGMELLMEERLDTTSDLHLLSEQGMTIGSFSGNNLARKELGDIIQPKIKDLLALMGLMLYQRGIRKEKYMDSLPYLYGQLLKISDALHALYCVVVRENNFPTQLVGSSVYQAAAETPVRTLGLLGQRMNPYITWAKTYSKKNIQEEGKESWRAIWLMSLYEKAAVKLAAAWRPEKRFDDEEKALLFIGYLADFPRKDETEQVNDTKS